MVRVRKGPAHTSVRWSLEGRPSGIQDVLDETGHICLFGVVKGEKWMILREEEDKTQLRRLKKITPTFKTTHH